MRTTLCAIGFEVFHLNCSTATQLHYFIRYALCLPSARLLEAGAMHDFSQQHFFIRYALCAMPYARFCHESNLSRP
jgi:hypothetical protein